MSFEAHLDAEAHLQGRQFTHGVWSAFTHDCMQYGTVWEVGIFGMQVH